MSDAYLLTWNPKQFDWPELPALTRKLAAKPVRFLWSCGPRKNLAKGSRVFLHRQGPHPRGVIGCGFTVSNVRRGHSWRDNGDLANYVLVEWDVLSMVPLVHLTELAQDPFKVVNWGTQSSGIRIPPNTAIALDRVISRALRRELNHAEDVAEEELHGVEGARYSRLIHHRMREGRLREKKIEVELKRNGGRLECEVPGCRFDFAFTYGAIGRKYAQVHHRRPLADYRGAETTRLEDLAIVCANCHAMIHRGGQCRSLRSLRVKQREAAGSRAR